MMQNKFQCVKEKIIENCPSCIKMHKDRIYISTYDFISENQQNGKIQVYDNKMELIDQIELKGITDFKIYKNLIFIVTVGSELIIGDISNPQIKILQTTEFKEKIKFLYLHVSENFEIIIGGDQGEVVFYEDEKYEVQKPHKFSTWALSFDNQHDDIYYSGGDDNLFIQYDRRQDQPCLINKQSHELGITYIYSQNDSIVTGSFDCHLRVFDKRNLNVPREEYIRDGCIWRIVKHGYGYDYLLALSTENKYEIVSLENNQIQEIQEFTGYGSLAYGCDWVNDRIATISYYDKLIKIHQ